MEYHQCLESWERHQKKVDSTERRPEDRAGSGENACEAHIG